MSFFWWVVLFFPALFVELFCYATNWLACIFVRQEVRTDRVKRLGNKQVTMLRDYPINFFNLWNTHDNALDEYWYGMFDEDSNKTQADYDHSWWFRYRNRVAWLMRNNAYGFLYTRFFSRPVESLLKQYQYGIEDKGFWYNLELYKSSFLLEAHLPMGKRYFTVKFGWKAHKTFPRKMFANRIPPFGIREYKK